MPDERVRCQSPVIGALVERLDETMPDDFRQRLRPLVGRSQGTADDGLDVQRAFACADSAVRVFAPMALEASGLIADAYRLRELPAIEDVRTARRAFRVTYSAGGTGRERPTCCAAHHAGAAAADDASAWAASYRLGRIYWLARAVKNVAVKASLAAILMGLPAYGVVFVISSAAAQVAGLAVGACAGALVALVVAGTYWRTRCQAAHIAAEAAYCASAVADPLAVWQTALDLVESLLPAGPAANPGSVDLSKAHRDL